MSYIRWSDDSDVYVYHNVNGLYSIHVAGNRKIAGKEFDDLKAFHMNAKDMEGYFNKCYEPINLGHDGDDFHEKTLEDTWERLMSLRLIGYRVPDVAFERIEKEMMELK